VAKHFQYEIDWTATQAEPRLEQHDLPRSTALISRENEESDEQESEHSDEWEHCSMPNPTALLEAVGRAAFGVDEEGNVNPGPEEVAEITEHHTERLVELLNRLQDIDDRLARASGDSRKPLYRQKDQALSAYQGALALYAEDFGQEAARQLDAWARHQIDSESEDDARELRKSRPHRYDPGHPWHYYREGDAAQPVPVQDIEPAADVGSSFAGALPRNAAKRNAKLRTMLDDHRRQLAEDKTRYQDLLDRGADALSEYDRNIAHGGNVELAWASAVALKYNHIRNGLGRIAWLEDQPNRETKPNAR
jgi:hypothetical protein